MTTTEQSKLLIQIMKDDLEKLRTMPAEEARVKGFKNLQAIGILDQDGNVTEGYRRTFIKDAQ